jgi:hypothetical protein
LTPYWERVGSSAGTNTLTGYNFSDQWFITGVNRGKVSGVNYSGFENLVGGTDVDYFKFSGGGKETNISGGGAPAGLADWLDYSSFPATHPVTVNLLLGKASNVSGSISGIEDMIGGAGRDILTGDNDGNILIEHGGAGTINGGTGRSLLIGGSGAATVNGGSGGDILIGGSTFFDTFSLLELMFFLEEWRSADSYAVRTQQISAGLGQGLGLVAGYTVTLNPSSTHEHLNAKPSSTDLDWFFASSPSQYSGLEPGELVNNP